jgi:hypothetical protein
LLFLVSLSQNALRLDAGPQHDRFECFVFLCIGWIGVFGGIFAWLANPALAVALVLMGYERYRRRALFFAAASLGLGLSFLHEKTWMLDESGSHVAHITGHAPGYWLWIASISVALIGCLYLTIDDRAEKGRGR